MDEQANKPSGDQQTDIFLLEEKYPFARREKRVQKVFIAVMLLFLIAGFLGLFSNGILSNRISAGSGYDIEYQKFVRIQTPDRLFIHLKNSDSSTDISVNREYLKNVRIEQVIPRPESVRSKNNQMVYTLNTAQTGLIIIYIKPLRAGIQELELGVDDEVKTIKQVTYF
ncbi:MAG: hypothetical protein WD317_06635 [Balneolaceae bacterium]